MQSKNQHPAPEEPLSEPEPPPEATEESAAQCEDGSVEATTSSQDTDDTEGRTEDVSLEALQTQLAEQRRQAEEYLAHLQRLQAEFSNYRRRMSQEQLQAASRGKEEVVRALLPIIGNFRLALQHAEEDANAVREGVQMIWHQLETFLGEHGIERLKTVGKPFDPAQHEALSIAPATAETPPNTIVAEINAGYTIDGRLLRPAQVVVARAADSTADDQSVSVEP
jgi:molecular chaperone GrpE